MIDSKTRTKPLRELLREHDFADLEFQPDHSLVSGAGRIARRQSRSDFGEGLAPDPVIERMRDAFARGRLFEEGGDALFATRAGVGPEEPNGRIDVAKVETLLARAGALDLDDLDGPTGLFGFDKESAIRRFQDENGLNQDGIVQPGGETMAALKARIAALNSGKVSSDSVDEGSIEPRMISSPIAPPPATADNTPTVSAPVPRRKPTPPPPPDVDDVGLSNATSPVRAPEIRNDGIGKGWFGADRTKTIVRSDGTKETVKYKHKAIDIKVAPGAPVRSPVDGTIERIGDPYGDRRFKIIWIRTDAGHRIGLFYVTPHDAQGNEMVKPRDKVTAGQTIGSAQNSAGRIKGMKNHLHLEVWKDGQAVDPTPWLKKWTEN